MRIDLLPRIILLAAALCGIGATNAAAQYCLPNYSDGCSLDDNINSFTLAGTGTTAIFDTGTHCSPGNYRNMSSSMSVTMAQGSTYSAYINTDFYDESAEVFIDFNNDGSFSASESVGGDNFIDNVGNTFAVSIPSGANTGSHRMRVVLSYDYAYSGIDACPDSVNGYRYGEVHDYTATITAGSGTSCSAPAALSASGITDTSARMIWSAVPGALGYEYVVNTTAGAPSGSGTATTATSVMPVTLASNSVYFLHVRTKCGTTSYSPWIEQQFVTNFSNPCISPDSFILTAMTPNTATLKWSGASGATGYDIFLSTVFLYPLNGTALTTNTASYTGLAANSTYYAYLRQNCTSTTQSEWAVLTFNTGRSFGSGPATVSGNIYKNASGVPSTDSYQVWLINHNSTAGTLTAIDSAKVVGSYTFRGMAVGSYLVKAAQLNGATGVTGQVPTYHDSSLYWSTAVSTPVTAGINQVRHIWMQQGTTTAGPGFIGGNVSLGANKGTAGGVPGVLIILRNAAGKLVKATYTDAAGDFSFANLPAGTYSVYPEQMGFATTAAAGITISSGSASKPGINFNQDLVKKSIKPRTTGIESASPAAAIQLSPNPAAGSVTIRTEGFAGGELQVSVTAITGQQVLRLSIAGPASVLDISALQPGIYFVRVHGAAGDAVQKLVVQP